LRGKKTKKSETGTGTATRVKEREDKTIGKKTMKRARARNRRKKKKKKQNNEQGKKIENGQGNSQPMEEGEPPLKEKHVGRSSAVAKKEETPTKSLKARWLETESDQRQDVNNEGACPQRG